MKKFTLIITIVFILFIGLNILVDNFLPSNNLTSKWIMFSNVYYYLLSLTLFFVSIIGLKSKSHKVFIKAVGVSMILRLLFSLLFIVIVIKFNQLDKASFVVANLIYYFVYMAFEIRNLVVSLRLDSEKYQK